MDGLESPAPDESGPEDAAPPSEEDTFAALEASLPVGATLADLDPEVLDDLRADLFALDDE